MTTYSTLGEIFRRGERGLRESSWVPVLVYCSPRTDGCLVGEIHQTTVGAIWKPKVSGLADRERRLAERMRRRTDIDWESPIDAADPKTLRLMTYGLSPLPVPLDAFKDDDVVQCECRDHGSSYVSARELSSTFAAATTPPTKIIKIAATKR